VRIVTRTLENLKHHDVADQQRLRPEQAAQAPDRFGRRVAQVADPGGTVDRDQPGQPSRMASRSPSQPSPASASPARR
jgi:hypothetical protein